MTRIAVARRPTELFEFVARSLAQHLSAAGHEVLAICDGDRRALDAELVIMVGVAHDFPWLCAQLNALGTRRPAVVLWQHEPLPPPDAPASLVALATRYAMPTWNDAVGAAGRWLDACAPLLGMWRRSLQRRWAPEFERALGLQTQDQPQLHPHGLLLVARQIAWFEQVASGRVRWLDAVACSVPSRVEYLRSRGIEAHYVPVRYDPWWGRQLDQPRDLDVLFLGRLKGSLRREAVERVLEQVRQRGWKMQVVTGDCFGEARTRMFNRARIVLNVLQFPWEFPGMRNVMAVACGTMMISEKCDHYGVWRAGRHFVPTSLDEMPLLVDRWLRDEPARRAFCHEASTDLTSTLAGARSAAQLYEIAAPLLRPRTSALSRAA